MVKQEAEKDAQLPASLQINWMAEVGVKKAHFLGQVVIVIFFKSKSLDISVLINKPTQREFGSCV